jgi:hypothetical protein
MNNTLFVFVVVFKHENEKFLPSSSSSYELLYVAVDDELFLTIFLLLLFIRITVYPATMTLPAVSLGNHRSIMNNFVSI